jgi:hypothetical protein
MIIYFNWSISEASIKALKITHFYDNNDRIHKHLWAKGNRKIVKLLLIGQVAAKCNFFLNLTSPTQCRMDKSEEDKWPEISDFPKLVSNQ